MRYIIILLFLLVNLNIQAQHSEKPKKYKVLFLDGSTKEIEGIIIFNTTDTSKGHNKTYKYCLMNSTEIICPSDVEYIDLIKKHKEIRYFPSPDSSAWLRKGIEGTITTYSYFDRGRRQLDFIQKGDRIYYFSPETLLEMLRDNQKIYDRTVAYYNKKEKLKHQNYKNLKSSLARTVGVVIGAGLGALMAANLSPGAGLIIIGSGMSALYITTLTQFTPYKAIKRYNRKYKKLHQA